MEEVIHVKLQNCRVLPARSTKDEKEDLIALACTLKASGSLSLDICVLVTVAYKL